MKKGILLGALSLVVVGIMAGSVLLGLELRPASAESVPADEKIASGNQSEISKEHKEVTHSYMDLGKFVVPVIKNGKTVSYISASVRLWVVQNGTSEGEDVSHGGGTEGGEPSEGGGAEHALLRDAVITTLYDLDERASLEESRDIENLRVMIKQATAKILGEGRVDRVLFDNLIQKPMS